MFSARSPVRLTGPGANSQQKTKTYFIPPHPTVKNTYTRVVPKCRIIVAQVIQTERYIFKILHAKSCFCLTNNDIGLRYIS